MRELFADRLRDRARRAQRARSVGERNPRDARGGERRR